MPHLLDIRQLDDSAIEQLLARSAELSSGAACHRRSGTIANLFCEPSTRTRVSFEMAARRLGLEVVNIDQAASSVSKGESLTDMARTLAAMGIGAIVLRHPDDFAAERLAATLPANGPAIINAGDGIHAHPSQALLDAATLAESGVDFAQMKVAIVGDLRHSRVARSDIELFSRLGVAEIRIAGPASLLPEPHPWPQVTRMNNLDAAIDGVDIIICLRIQRERIDAQAYPDGEAFHRDWGLTEQRAARLPEHVRILHPGPVNRGIEIADQVADSPRSLILEQVRIGVHLRTALFEWLMPA
ncbi:MAG: aspartate carbamoyltransferase catalytic subunit [Wenzhouxiangellaceae bacterium]|nr:aspartate carbamoyltransferase catalytic subunit [Wenzhouxiangellaceae bacterium]